MDKYGSVIGWRRILAAGALAACVLWPAERPVEALGIGCSISSVSSINFGAYDPLGDSPSDSVGSITVSCLIAGGLEISIDGVYSGGVRHLTAGSDTLNYNIYSDASRTRIIGDGTFGTQSYSRSFTGILATAVTTLYGRIPANQDVRAGTYSDSLVITVNF